MNFSQLKNGKSSFYEVSDEDIQQSENAMKIKLPSELVKFYKEIGYGFFDSQDRNINRLMDPLSVRDFRLRQNDFEFYPDIEMYDEFEENRLIFFEANESILFSIELGDGEKQKIFLYNTVIAESLEEFIVKLEDNENFYMDR